MSKFEKGLQQWVAQGFITAEQAAAIKTYENRKPENSWVLTGLLVLGVSIIAIGIISLIAANWSQISDGIKLFVDFLLLAAIAYGIDQTKTKNHPVVFEALLLLFNALCLASIGLISQIFHTGGQLYQALFLWSVMTAPVVALSRSFFVPYTWIGGALAALALGCFNSEYMQSILQRNWVAIALSVPLLCTSFAILCRSLIGEAGPTRAFRVWALHTGLIGLVINEFNIDTYKSTFMLPESDIAVKYLISNVIVYLLAVISALGVIMSLEYRRLQKNLLLCCLALYILPLHFRLFAVGSYFLSAVMTIVTLAGLAIFVASLGDRKSFQWILGLIGIRFLCLYFQALSGLAMTGLGLIISGVVVLGVATIWNKYRNRLADWAEGYAR